MDADAAAAVIAEAARALWEKQVLVDAAAADAPAGSKQSLAMPRSLVEPLDVDGWRLLAATRDDVPLQPVPDIDEASTAWPLRPRPIPRKPSLAAKIAEARDACPTTNAYPHDWPTTADCWRPRFERRASGLSCLEEQYHLRGWAVESAFPAYAPGPNAEDALSDSESEDEAAYAELKIPTWDECKAVFRALDDEGDRRDDAAGAASPRSDADGAPSPRAANDKSPRDGKHDKAPASPKKDADADSTKSKSPRSAASSPRKAPPPPDVAGDAGAAPAGGDDPDAVISDIPRDRERLELCRQEAERRSLAATLLPDRKRAIAAAVRHPLLRDKLFSEDP